MLDLLDARHNPSCMSFSDWMESLENIILPLLTSLQNEFRYDILWLDSCNREFKITSLLWTVNTFQCLWFRDGFLEWYRWCLVRITLCVPLKIAHQMELRVMLKGRQLDQWFLVPLLPQLSLSNGSYWRRTLTSWCAFIRCARLYTSIHLKQWTLGTN